MKNIHEINRADVVITDDHECEEAYEELNHLLDHSSLMGGKELPDDKQIQSLVRSIVKYEEDKMRWIEICLGING